MATWTGQINENVWSKYAIYKGFYANTDRLVGQVIENILTTISTRVPLLDNVNAVREKFK